MRFKSTEINITLIRPPTLELRSNLSSYGAIPPIGLAYIAAILRDVGHKVSVIDAPGEAIDRFVELKSPVGPVLRNGLTPEEIVNRIGPDTEIIGISHMFLHEWPTVQEIAESARARFPEAMIILGGENATSFWEHIFAHTEAIDYCVLGEGEVTVVELIRRLQEGEPANDLQGLVSRTETGRISRLQTQEHQSERHSLTYAQEAALPLAKRVQDVNLLSWPAWEYFPIENYIANSDRLGVHRGRSIPMIATRGCPYQCTFCSNPQMWTTKYVTRKPQDVVDEMKHYIQRYRVDNIDFCDLTAIIKKEWIVEFCEILRKENLNISWQLPTGTRSEALDEEVLKRVYETGCRNITYAPESGSERVLKAIKKKVQIPRLINSLKQAHRAGLVTRVNIIIGHPEERRADIWQSLKFLVQCALLGCQDTAVMIFAPYPGSEDFKKLVSQGKVTICEDYYYLPLARSGWSSKTYNPRMGTRELIAMQFFMLMVFYGLGYLTHPRRIFELLRSLVTGHEQTQLDQLIRTKFLREPKLRKSLQWAGQFFFGRTFRNNETVIKPAEQ